MLRLHAEVHVRLHVCLPLLLTFNKIWNALATLSTILVQGCTTVGCQVTWATEFCVGAHSICSAHLQNLLHMPLLRWHLDVKENLCTLV
jgi:hypothetical protein